MSTEIKNDNHSAFFYKLCFFIKFVILLFPMQFSLFTKHNFFGVIIFIS